MQVKSIAENAEISTFIKLPFILSHPHTNIGFFYVLAIDFLF